MNYTDQFFKVPSFYYPTEEISFNPNRIDFWGPVIEGIVSDDGSSIRSGDSVATEVSLMNGDNFVTSMTPDEFVDFLNENYEQRNPQLWTRTVSNLSFDENGRVVEGPKKPKEDNKPKR